MGVTTGIKKLEKSSSFVRQVRAKSLAQAKKLGYSTSDHLPLIDEHSEVRSAEELANRMLCMNVVLAVASGYSRDEAVRWLSEENLVSALAKSEKTFLQGNCSDTEIQLRAEALWALAWCAGLVRTLDFAKPCNDTLVTFFPNLKTSDRSTVFRTSLTLRDREALVAQCDLAYCLHWSVRDALMNGKRPPGKLHPIYIVERRHALEWVLSKHDWDEVPLDT